MTNDIGRQLADHERRLRRMERASRLGSASLDGTALQVLDPDNGGLRGIVGVQADGTTAVNIVNGAAPAAPSTPTVSPALGGIAVTWDGTLTTGAVLPLDWARIEVHASPTDGFTPDPTTLQATIETPQGATVYLPATVAQYVVLLARNTSGAASDPSAQAGPYEPRAVVGSDLADGSITETLIADNAITTPKIRAGAVEADKLAANSVTTAALTVGCVDATAIKSDAITGKTITGGTVTGAVVQTADTGQRLMLDDDGAIKVYDTDGNPTTYIGGADNIVWNNAGWAPDGTPDGEFVGMWTGNFILGQGDPQAQGLGTMGLLGVTTEWGMTLQSPSEPSGSGGFESNLFATLLSGKPSSQSGTVNAPQMQVQGDVGVTNAVVKLSSNFDTTSWRYTPETWRTPTMGTGWATGPGIAGGYPPLRAHLDAHDNLHLHGTLHATTTSPNPIICTGLPAVNTATLGGVGMAGAMIRMNSGGTSVALYLDELGRIHAVALPTIAVNDTFEVNSLIPLGNIA